MDRRIGTGVLVPAYTNEGESREPMYNTRIRLDAEFGDFEKLSEFIDTWSGEEGVTIDGVRWDVHEASRRAHERELRREAVEDAIAKRRPTPTPWAADR